MKKPPAWKPPKVPKAPKVRVGTAAPKFRMRQRKTVGVYKRK